MIARRIVFSLIGLTALGMVGCLSASPVEAAEPSPVRVRIVEAHRTPLATDVILTGDIQAQAQVNVSFRTNGKVAERRVEVGDHVTADQVLGILQPLTQQANLDNAKAALTSAEASLTQAKMAFERQKQLLTGGFTTRSTYDNAEQDLRTRSNSPTPSCGPAFPASSRAGASRSARWSSPVRRSSSSPRTGRAMRCSTSTNR